MCCLGSGGLVCCCCSRGGGGQARPCAGLLVSCCCLLLNPRASGFRKIYCVCVGTLHEPDKGLKFFPVLWFASGNVEMELKEMDGMSQLSV